MKEKAVYPVGTVTKLLQTLERIAKYARKLEKGEKEAEAKQAFYLIGKVAQDAIEVATE